MVGFTGGRRRAVRDVTGRDIYAASHRGRAGTYVGRALAAVGRRGSIAWAPAVRRRTNETEAAARDDHAAPRKSFGLIQGLGVGELAICSRCPMGLFRSAVPELNSSVVPGRPNSPAVEFGRRRALRMARAALGYFLAVFTLVLAIASLAYGVYQPRRIMRSQPQLGKP